MTPKELLVFRTGRLVVRRATTQDAKRILDLWTDPRVTTFVGFPRGIPTSQEEIRAQIERDQDRPLRALLIAETSNDGKPIGEVKLGEPNERGISEPDVKLFPEHWGKGYGRELWGAMIDRLFGTTDCQIVQGTPNVANTASIRMMESCGMSRVGQGVFEPVERWADLMVPVPHHVYQIARADWDNTLRERAG